MWKRERNDINLGNKNSKLELCSMIKYNYGFEEYLNLVKDFNIRKTITQLRVSAHPFPIEKGRHNKIPRDDRKCTICNENQIGNEFHYLFQCTNIELMKIRLNFKNDI